MDTLNPLRWSKKRKPGLPGWAMTSCGTLACLSLAVDHGFGFEWTSSELFSFIYFILLAVYGLDALLALSRADERKTVAHERIPEICLLFSLGLVAFAWLVWPERILSWVRVLFPDLSSLALASGFSQIAVLSFLMLQILRLQASILTRTVRPEFILTGSFLLLISLGTLLLLLPRSSAVSENPVGIVDALFTATSASCVTGLVVRDTGTEFSLLGQGVILTLFQVGGLGIMTFVAFLAIYSIRSLPLPQMLVFQKLLAARSLGDVRRHVILILGITLGIELAGAALFYSQLPGDWQPGRKAWWGVFHSVSAFCNAGFALQSDSLIFVKDQPLMLAGFMTLIIVGGLGFLVIPDLIGVQVSRLPFIRKIPAVRAFNLKLRNKRFSVQAKLALLVSAGLLIAGFAGFWLLENKHNLAGEPLANRFLISAFQSVTARTAGFNTTPIDALQDSTLILIIGLMVIGACPVSTGGGIKTVTFGVLICTMKAMITGRERVEVFNRALPAKVIIAALSVTVLYGIMTVLGVFCLAVFDPQMKLQDQLFEAISALSTVGLSTGVTGQLSAGSKLTLCVLMFVGRVGPVTLMLSIFHAGARSAYEYPEENLIVG